jgi:hypothetical protein
MRGRFAGVGTESELTLMSLVIGQRSPGLVARGGLLESRGGLLSFLHDNRARVEAS